MDRMTKITINGIERCLNFSIEIMFDVNDKFGGVQSLLDVLTKKDREAIAAVRWCAVRLINDGELCRRESGYDPLPMMNEKDISARMNPADFETVRAAVVAAITAGFKREVTAENEERDLGLEELNAKK